ncbi:MAG: hypothetical protein ACLS37_13560 [Alistipes sp.]
MKRKNIIWILCALVVVLAIVGLLLWRRAVMGCGTAEIFIGSRTVMPACWIRCARR